MDDNMTARHWLALVGLTFAAFIFNTSEFVPIGLLTDIRDEFGLTEASAGMLISVYAWVVMLLSLPLMILVSRMEMRRLMLCLVGLFAVCQALSFLSDSYLMLMASRIGVACTHCVFWSVVSPIAVRITPARHKALALSMVVTGSSVAMVLGMPLGRMIGLHLGWRMTFLCVGLFALFTLFYIACSLPRVPSSGRFSPRRLPTLLADRTLVGFYAFTLLLATGYYICYSYIEPFLKQVALMPDDWVTAMLTLMGVAGLLGSLVFSRYYAKAPSRFIGIMVAGVVVALLGLQASARHEVAIVALIALMGLTSTAYNVAMQSALIQAVPPESTTVAMSIFSGIFNMGIGCGAFFGGQVCSGDTLGHVGLAGGVVALVALLFWMARLGRRMFPRQNS